MERADAVRIAWQRGLLRWKLRAHQTRLYEHLRGSKEVKTVAVCARQFGKTFTVLLYLVEQAIRNPGWQIGYAALTEKSLKKIIRPNMRILLADCPERLRPQWNPQESSYVFPNGSEIHLAGIDTENGREKLRGPFRHINVIDECGSADSEAFEYVENDIMIPQLQETDGQMFCIGTRPRVPDHRFDKLAEEAEHKGVLLVQTIDDNTHLTQKKRDRLIDAVGGADSIAAQVEFFCHKVRDPKRTVIPEWTDEAEAAIVQDFIDEPYYLPMVSMDVGFGHFTAILFGYYAFRAAKVRIIDEVLLPQARTDQIAKAIAEKEKELWPNPHPDRPIIRWSDVDLRLIEDLSFLHGLKFTATLKDDLEAQVNNVRLEVQRRTLQVKPRCVNLRAHVKNARWNKSRSEFDESKVFGHFDALASLIYFIRNVNRVTNPYPALADGISHATHYIPPHLSNPLSETSRAIADALVPRRKRR